ncbi:hypothetical protein [Sinorhizobium americanum]|uniref:Uncharacterized protein n=1 Tax=Sinorhizobium americanum TaxID=194963 RepID=A0A1L3LMB8_9HYPH|nr:hypothetical protein [Sinorhizobium americanum]APG84597.1 hypothetical protein SAMCCGM7_Ch1850 [Sinorhizobium americanum CCGM7]APG91250.1 hypothetical protein SAMCFNEI73_Ch1963 [Sinorhizobium americanum]TCN30442.1 hypothetical protein EV184_108322 [Sinorhizobium americanum]
MKTVLPKVVGDTPRRSLIEHANILRFIVDSGIFGVSLARTFAYKPLLA